MRFLLRCGLMGLLSAGLDQHPLGQAAQSAPAAQAPAPKTLTAEEWRADLRHMVKTMERRHRNLYHTVSREEFAKAVAELDRRIPQLQRHEIIVEMMRLAAMIGDGHTNIFGRQEVRGEA